MPIVIYAEDVGPKNKRTELCDDEWDLPVQVAALERWLKRKKKLPHRHYVADIGFKIRKDACGGGAVLSPAFMHSLAQRGFSVFLSEYR